MQKANQMENKQCNNTQRKHTTHAQQHILRPHHLQQNIATRFATQQQTLHGFLTWNRGFCGCGLANLTARLTTGLETARRVTNIASFACNTAAKTVAKHKGKTQRQKPNDTSFTTHVICENSILPVKLLLENQKIRVSLRLFFGFSSGEKDAKGAAADWLQRGQVNPRGYPL
jgi:hypothetical protein